MNPMKLPKDRVEALDPATLERHIHRHGWIERPHPEATRFGVFYHPEHPEEELVLLRDKTYPDFALRMGEVLVTLGTVEKRRVWEVLDDLLAQPQPTSKNGARRRAAAKAEKTGS